MTGEYTVVNRDEVYRAYLLRLWRVTVGGRTMWRASLECPHSGERTGFASLEALFDHLRAHTSGMPEGGEH